MNYVEGEHFKNEDYLATRLDKGEYEDCIFEDCVFSNANLSGIVFVECKFLNCDLSNANINLTAFREVRFIGCKMLGLRFEVCNEFLLAVDFKECRLDSSVFYQRQLKGTTFIDCSLKDVDFAEAKLNKCDFQGSDFSGAQFDRTNLEKSDFRGASNYIIDPEINTITKAKFSLPGLPGLLTKYDISIG